MWRVTNDGSCLTISRELFALELTTSRSLNHCHLAIDLVCRSDGSVGGGTDEE
jgi:hypothetical protein